MAKDIPVISVRPGVCSVDLESIHDAPGSGLMPDGKTNKGYLALYPERDEDGKPKLGKDDEGKAVFRVPAHKRTLCKAHYLVEWAEKYPDEADPV